MIVIENADIIKWMGILFGSYIIGFANGYLLRAFRRMLEMAGGG